MKPYLAQCKHRVDKNDKVCPICNNKIQRIWNINKLGIDNAIKLADSWNKNEKPEVFYNKQILPYNRDEYIYNMCSEWDNENPNADETTRMEAFRNIISKVFRAEYERSCKDDDYYTKVKFNKYYVSV